MSTLPGTTVSGEVLQALTQAPCVASNSRPSGEVGQWFVWPAIVDQVVRLDSGLCGQQ